MRSATASAPVKFARERYFPPGWEPYLAQFLSLFNRFAYIYKPLSGDSWYSADEKWRLSDAEILKAIACAHPRFFIGCRAGKASRFAVLDIDADSKYHNKSQLDKLLKVLSDAGLSRSSLFRSSSSDGWHLYLFFDEQISSADLHRQLVKLLTLNDFVVARGTLEVFPHRTNRHSTGMGLRLPLQPGFAWLDKNNLDLDYDRAELSATKALELFLDALDADANSYSVFRKLKAYNENLENRNAKKLQQGSSQPSNVIAIRKTADILQPSQHLEFVKSIFQKLPPGIIPDNWYKGRLFHLHGLAAPSQRADAIVCLGHYFFYGDPSRNIPAQGYGCEQEREWAIRKFLSARHNGQSKDINADKPDALAQVTRAANWRPSHASRTTHLKYSAERPIAWIRANDKSQKNARQRIQEALDTLKKQQRAFTTVELQKIAQCSRETLYKHKDIWRAVYEDRKDYRDLSSGFFANCTGEYNEVEGAVSPPSVSPLPASSQTPPPGLLAARRIAYEISMRSERQLISAEKKAAKRNAEQAELWRDEVSALSKTVLGLQSLSKLKALLTVLLHYLSLAPTHEDETQLRSFISLVRRELTHRFETQLLQRQFDSG